MRTGPSTVVLVLVTAEGSHQIIENAYELRTRCFGHENFARVLGMCAQVFLTPELQREQQTVPCRGRGVPSRCRSWGPSP